MKRRISVQFCLITHLFVRHGHAAFVPRPDSGRKRRGCPAFEDVARRRLAEHEASRSELEASRLAPWSPLSVHRLPPIARAASVRAGHVDADAATGVMLRGHDTNRLRVMSMPRPSSSREWWGMRAHELRGRVADVEVDVVEAVAFDLIVVWRGATRRAAPALRTGSYCVMLTLAGAGLISSAFAAHRLGDEEVLDLEIVEEVGGTASSPCWRRARPPATPRDPVAVAPAAQC